MFSEIRLKNFKQFEEFRIGCKKDNILVGPNNSGKSTVLDALRVCADVVRYSRRRNPVPRSFGDAGACAYLEIDHRSLSIPIVNTSRNYNDDDAEIHIRHANGNRLHILLNRERPVRAYLQSDSPVPRSASMFNKLFPADLIVVPTLGPFEEIEPYLRDKTIQGTLNTRNAHRHFRNVWHRESDEKFSEFAYLVSETWPSIRVEKPRLEQGVDPSLTMMFYEDRIPREVYWSGFGLQIWLQMLTQTMRGGQDSTLVLDEPDIYLHSDLQKRLLRFVKDRFAQYFMATHSTEIINEANAGDVLSIAKGNKSARRIASEEGYRGLFAYLGSSENAEFSRMVRAKRIVFFEGKDRKIIRWFAERAGGFNLVNDPDTLFLQAGGFGQWARVKHVNWTLDKVVGLDVKIGAIFDMDYRCAEEIGEFLRDINSESIRCHVLSRKEIENFALEPKAIIRILIKRASESGKSIGADEAELLLESLVAKFEQSVRSQRTGLLFDYLKTRAPHKSSPTLMTEAHDRFDGEWCDLRSRLRLVPGKEFISTLSAECQARFVHSITIRKLINELTKDEFPEDLRAVLSDLELFFGSTQ